MWGPGISRPGAGTMGLWVRPGCLATRTVRRTPYRQKGGPESLPGHPSFLLLPLGRTLTQRGPCQGLRGLRGPLAGQDLGGGPRDPSRGYGLFGHNLPLYTSLRRTGGTRPVPCLTRPPPQIILWVSRRTESRVQWDSTQSAPARSAGADLMGHSGALWEGCIPTSRKTWVRSPRSGWSVRSRRA